MKNENRIRLLMGNLAAVMEQDGYTYQESICALEQLTEYYKVEGTVFLEATNILEIARHRQSLYEQKITASSAEDTAE